MADWGRGFFDRRDDGSGIDRVLADMQVRQDQRQQRNTQASQFAAQMNQQEREMANRVLAAFMANPSKQTYDAAKAAGAPLPDWVATPEQEASSALANARKGLIQNTELDPFQRQVAATTLITDKVPNKEFTELTGARNYMKPETFNTFANEGFLPGSEVTKNTAAAGKDTAEAAYTSGPRSRQANASATESLAGAGLANERSRVLRTQPVGGGASDPNSDISMTAKAIMDGDQPPVLTGLYKSTLAVRGELARKGYDLTKAMQDWKATEKYLSTLNGPQQVRLRQAVEFTYHSLDVVDEMNKEWNGGGFPVLNKANLMLAKQGVLGQEAQSIATKLDSQISDLVSELAVVYRGGNASTDEALKLAAANLKEEWGKKTLADNIGLVRKNLDIRRNSLKTVGAVANDNNTYQPAMGGKPAGGTVGATGNGGGYDAQTQARIQRVAQDHFGGDVAKATAALRAKGAIK